MGLNVLVRINKDLYKLIKNKQKEVKRELGIDISFPSASELILSELIELRKKRKSK